MAPPEAEKEKEKGFEVKKAWAVKYPWLRCDGPDSFYCVKCHDKSKKKRMGREVAIKSFVF